MMVAYKGGLNAHRVDEDAWAKPATKKPDTPTKRALARHPCSDPSPLLLSVTPAPIRHPCAGRGQLWSEQHSFKCVKRNAAV